MAIAMLENFGNLPTDKALQSLSPIPFGAVAGGWAVYTTGTTLGGKTDGLFAETASGKTWLTRYNTGVAYPGIVQANIPAMGAGTSRMIIGARYRFRVTSADVTFPSIRFNAAAFSVNTPQPAGVAEVYVEHVIDRNTGNLDIYVDGVLKVTVTIGASSVTALKNGTETIQLAVGGPTGVSVSDVYVITDTADASPNARLGPMDITAVELVVADGQANWDTTNLAAVLARGDFETTDSGTRLSGTGSPLNLVPKAGAKLVGRGQVAAMCLQVKGAYKAGYPGNMSVSLARGSNAATTPTIVLPAGLASLPQAILVNQSKTSDELAAATALNNLAVTITPIVR